MGEPQNGFFVSSPRAQATAAPACSREGLPAGLKEGAYESGPSWAASAAGRSLGWALLEDTPTAGSTHSPLLAAQAWHGALPSKRDETLCGLNSYPGLSQDSSGDLSWVRDLSSPVCVCTGHGTASRITRQERDGESRGQSIHAGRSECHWHPWRRSWDGTGSPGDRAARVTTFPTAPGLPSLTVPTFQDGALNDRQKWPQGRRGPGFPAPSTSPRCPVQPWVTASA